MNGIERITGRIRNEAQEEADRRVDTARKSAQEILDRYRAQAESESRSLSDKNVKTAAAREGRLVSMAQMEARKTILAARQEDIRALSKLIADCMNQNNICVFGNEAVLKEHAEIFGEIKQALE